jgi:beta-glucanase (GH16 family)
VVVDNVPYNFTSGWVDTRGGFSQDGGKFSVRARLPDDLATMSWAGHWLLPDPARSVPPAVCWPLGGQIDISERVSGRNNGTVHAQLHWGKVCGVQTPPPPPGVYPPPGRSANFFHEFHTFSVEWFGDRVRWFVDGNCYLERSNTTSPIPQDPMFLILNTAVAKSQPVGDGVEFYPTYHVVDYVKIYEQA